MQHSYIEPVDNLTGKIVSIKQAVKILERSGIKATEKETKIILDFLYLLAKANKQLDQE